MTKGREEETEGGGMTALWRMGSKRKKCGGDPLPPFPSPLLSLSISDDFVVMFLQERERAQRAGVVARAGGGGVGTKEKEGGTDPRHQG